MVSELVAGPTFWNSFNWIDQQTILSFESLEDLVAVVVEEAERQHGEAAAAHRVLTIADDVELAGPVTGEVRLTQNAIGLNYIILLATGLGILLSANYIPQVNRQIGEY